MFRGLKFVVLVVGISLLGSPVEAFLANDEQGGAIANRTGRQFEHKIQVVIAAHGYQVQSYSNWKKAKVLAPSGSKILLTNAPYTNIYGGGGRSEFLLLSDETLKNAIRIEAKWKQSSGSTDERLVYLYLNAIETYPENHIIIVVDGKGWRKGAVNWLIHAAKTKAYTTLENRQKQIEVMDFTAFEAWIKRQ